MAQNEYIYAVTRTHMREGALLSGGTLEQMLTAPDYDACLAILSQKGWDTTSGDPGAILMSEEDKTWDFIADMVEDMSPFDVFLLANDYHNLKAAVKKTVTGSETEPVYLGRGTLQAQDVRRAVETGELFHLPDEMARAAGEALSVLRTSMDGQLCDVIIDAAALAAIAAAGAAAENEILKSYAELTVAAADIKTAVRCARLKKPQAFIRAALAQCQTVSCDRLAKAAAAGEDALYGYLADTDYAEAAPALRQSTAAFERWCDDRLMQTIRPQRTESFGIGPLAAYILARQNEIKSVRMILSAQQNHLPTGPVRERLREMYV